MPRATKASQILNDAAMRLEAAKIRERAAQSEWNVATAALVAHQDAYDSLEQALTPKPRKKPATPPQAPSTTTKAPKADINSNARCTDQVPGLDVPCGELETNRIHDQTAGYASYHPFASSVPSATRRSSRKGSGTGSEVVSETSKGAAAGASGD